MMIFEVAGHKFPTSGIVLSVRKHGSTLQHSVFGTRLKAN